MHSHSRHLRQSLGREAAVLLSLLAMIMMWSCDTDTLYHQYRSLPAKGWDSQRPLTFSFDSIPATADYTLSVELRITHEVPFQKIYVVAEQDFENPTMHRRDTLEIPFTDRRGNTTTNGIYLFTTSATLPTPIRLHQDQNGTIRLTHIMRRNPMTGIKDVGLRLTK